ncbi:hypothetical protein HDU83_004187 [Entophlyctis luteolus]|nr:hypothetical protein HDU83_004187 [Entophlyctis luteolus]
MESGAQQQQQQLARTVAIIGCGASGVAALQQARECGLDATVFEARDRAGGAWIVDDDPGPCDVTFDADGVAALSSPNALASPMYESLRTNVPTILMQYNGRSFPSSSPLFPGPAVVEKYIVDTLGDGAAQVKFNTRVVNLRWTREDGDSSDEKRWTLDVECTRTGETSTFGFDCVVIANGHYQKPYVPFIPGLDTFPNKIIHSRWYRRAAAYAGQTVLVVGNNASGYDCVRELAQQFHSQRQHPDASLCGDVGRVYQSARSPSLLGIPFDRPDAPDWCKEVVVLPQISSISGRAVRFEDGTLLENVDTILFATGYYFSFPFASPRHAPFDKWPLTKAVPLPDGRVAAATRDDGGLRVHNLDSRDIFYLPDPTLALIGLPFNVGADNTLLSWCLSVLPFPLAQIQSRVAMKCFSKQRHLPVCAGTGADAPETKAALVYGHPKQYDVQDALLKEIGEGGGAAGSGGDDDDVRGIYASTPQELRDLRAGAKALRYAVLGY